LLGFEVLSQVNILGLVIAKSVIWENPNTRNKCETQLGLRTNVTLPITALILVMDDSTTREDSWVTLGGWI
jgi:hypothetical protein